MSDSAGIPFLPAQKRWPSAKVGEDVNGGQSELRTIARQHLTRAFPVLA